MTEVVRLKLMLRDAVPPLELMSASLWIGIDLVLVNDSRGPTEFTDCLDEVSRNCRGINPHE